MLAAIVILPIAISAQTEEQILIDSMLPVFKVLKDDTNKVKLLNKISFTYFTVNPEEGIHRGEQGLALAKKLNWQKGLAGAFHSLGANYWAKHATLQAQNMYWECLKINELLADKKGIAKSLHDLAMTYEMQYDYRKALEYYEKALTLYEEMGDKYATLGCVANIANVYEVKKDYTRALEYFLKSLKLCEEYGNERHIAYMSTRVGSIYMFLGRYAKALEYETKALQTLKKFPDKNIVAAVLGNIGDIYQKQHDYQTGLEYYDKALTISSSVNSNWSRGYVGKYLCDIGNIYISMATDKKWQSSNKNINNQIFLQKALTNFKKAINMSESVGDDEGLRDSYQALSQAQFLQNNFKASLESYKQYIFFKDSLNNTEKDKEMNRHEMEYMSGKNTDSLNYMHKLQQSEIQKYAQEKRLTDLTLKQQSLYSIVALIVLCLTGFLFFFYYRTKRRLYSKNELIRERSEKQFKETEYQQKVNDITASALRSQMNPHFIFNALNTIQSYIYSNDKKSAGNYLGKFSELIRKVLDNSNKQEITLEEEIHLLQLYIDIEKARFGESICVTLDMDPNLESEHILVPPMLIQPYAENAIKHGLLHQKGEKKLLIKLSRSNDQQFIEIIIDDNGIGRKKSIEINKMRIGHHSFANDANEKRINLINQISNKKTRLQIIDKKNFDGTPAGTTVIINIPVISMESV